MCTVSQGQNFRTQKTQVCLLLQYDTTKQWSPTLDSTTCTTLCTNLVIFQLAMIGLIALMLSELIRVHFRCTYASRWCSLDGSGSSPQTAAHSVYYHRLAGCHHSPSTNVQLVWVLFSALHLGCQVRVLCGWKSSYGLCLGLRVRVVCDSHVSSVALLC